MIVPSIPSDSRVFITGGAGFIGSNLAERCLDAERVTIFDNFTRDAINDGVLAGRPNIEIVKGDVLDRAHLAEAMQGHDFIFHCAAVLGVDAVRSQPVTTLNVNVMGSAAVLEAASHIEDLRRIVCFSSSEIYGVRAVNVSESDPASIPPATDARWGYAASKLAEEHFAFAYQRHSALPISVVRPFNVYGPGQVGEGAISNFIRKALRGEPLQVRGDGGQIRAWCYIEDLVNGVMRAAIDPRGVGQVFNIGNPWAVETTLGLAHRVLIQSRSRSSIEHVPESADVEIRVPDVRKARDLLGHHPKVGLEEGIERSIAWFRMRIS